MKFQKEILYQIFSLLTASISIAIVFSILNYNKIAENTYRSLYPYLLQQNYREAFLTLQNSKDFNIQKIVYKPKNSKSINLFQTSTTPFKYSKKLPLFISEFKDTSLGILYIDFNFFPELKTLFYSIFFLTFIFGPLYWKFIRISQQVRTEKIRNQVTSQIFHDIQSPLVAFKNSLSHASADKHENLQDIFYQINNMIESLSPRSQKVQESEVFITEINTFLKSIAKSKQNELKDCKIRFKLSEQGLYTEVNPALFQRTISNLINNAYEAYQFKTEKTIAIQITSNSRNIILHIEDFGCGVPKEKLQDILTQGTSFNKPKGSGLGLSFAQDTIKSLNGQLSIHSVLNQGTCVKISLPRSSDERKRYYLLEDDLLIKTAWQRSADLKGIHLKTFSSTKELLNQLESFQQEDTFYLDSNLNNDEKGEEVARILYQKGFQNLYLVTGYSKEKFKSFDFIKGIYGKEPIFDF